MHFVVLTVCHHEQTQGKIEAFSRVALLCFNTIVLK